MCVWWCSTTLSLVSTVQIWGCAKNNICLIFLTHLGLVVIQTSFLKLVQCSVLSHTLGRSTISHYTLYTHFVVLCSVCVLCVCVTSHCLHTQDVFRLLLTVVEARYELTTVCSYAWHAQCYVHGIERLLVLVDVVR